MFENCRKTIVACFIAYITQAVIVNFAPLLFVTFQEQYKIPLEQITLLATLNFIVQLMTDFVASRYAQKIGYRKCVVAAHILAGLGFVMMTVLPDIIGGFAGLMVSTVIYAVGGGLIEVLISPIVEACPTKNKAGIMSLMHSFYSWGVLLTALLSTGFFVLAGIDNWKYMALIWALVPFINAICFARVKIYPLETGGDDKPNYRELFSQKVFWIMILLMICSGASEIAVSNWTSTFAEIGLNVNKTVGDLLAVCGFALFMGLSRVVYAKFSEKIPMKPYMIVCGILCVTGYCMIGFAKDPIIGLIGCMVCGFAVGIFWPGTFSLATKNVRAGGTTMFALLAFAGDTGCSLGPTVAGFMTGVLNNNLSHGIFCAVIFPILLIIGLCFLNLNKKRKNKLTE